MQRLTNRIKSLWWGYKNDIQWGLYNTRVIRWRTENEKGIFYNFCEIRFPRDFLTFIYLLLKPKFLIKIGVSSSITHELD